MLRSLLTLAGFSLVAALTAPARADLVVGYDDVDVLPHPGKTLGAADLDVYSMAAVPDASPLVFGGLLCGALGLWRLRRNRRREEVRI